MVDFNQRDHYLEVLLNNKPFCRISPKGELIFTTLADSYMVATEEDVSEILERMKSVKAKAAEVKAKAEAVALAAA